MVMLVVRRICDVGVDKGGVGGGAVDGVQVVMRWCG